MLRVFADGTCSAQLVVLYAGNNDSDIDSRIHYPKRLYSFTVVYILPIVKYYLIDRFERRESYGRFAAALGQ